ncbi:hypothetical protein [Hymenobacter sp. B81]|uniref:hypothetical protein n=1 Tax=Hymenobacter sp. B81 TaxID=3344878 RepID=UPI0037DC576F
MEENNIPEVIAEDTEMVDKKGNPTQRQIDAWTAEHGKVKQFEVDGKVVCFSQPDRKTVGAANQVLVRTKDVTKYADTILANCQLNFKAETAADDELYFALQSKVDEIVTSKVATLKN